MEDQYKNDSKEVKKLLKKLQETFLSPSDAAAGKQSEDANDRKFREQLAKMLKLDTSPYAESPPTEEKPVKAKKQGSSHKEKPSDPIEAPILEEPIADEPLASDEPQEPTEISVKQDEPPVEMNEPAVEVNEQALEMNEPAVEVNEPAVAVNETLEKLEASPAPLSPKKPRKKNVSKPPKVEIEPQPIVKLEPIIEPEPIVEPEPIIEPEPIALPEPIIEPEPIALPEPIIEPEPIDLPEPIGKNEVAKVEKASSKTVFILEKQEPVYTVEATEQLSIPVEAFLPNGNEPIVIRPRQALTKRKVGADTSSNGGIVIRPQTEPLPQTEKIVIAPGSIQRIPMPKKTVRRQIAEKPIKIGKEILPADQRKEIPNPADKPKPIMKKEQNTTLIPPATAPEAAPKSTTRVIAKGPATPSKKPGVTMPRSSSKTDTGSDGGSEPPRQKQKLKSSAKKQTTQRSTVRKQPVAQAEPVSPIIREDDAEEILEASLMDEIPLDAAEEIEPIDQPISPSLRRLGEKQRRREEALSPLDLICKRSGLCEDDVFMMLELGYENELGRLVGFDALKRIKTERMRMASQKEGKHHRTSFGYRGEEYVDETQRNGVRAAYVKDRNRLILRTTLTALATLVLFFLSTPKLLGAQAEALHSSLPFLFPVCSMLVLIGAALLSKRQILSGLRSMFKFSPTPYSVLSLLLPITIAYDCISLFAKSDMLAIDLLASAVLLLTAMCDVLRLSNEIRTFRIVSADGEKTVLDAVTPKKRKLRRGNKIVRIASENLGENLYHVRKALQCGGFFRRSNTMRSAKRPFTMFLAVMSSLAVAATLAAAVVTDSLSVAISTFAAVLLCAAPLSAVFSYFYPIYRANRLLYKANSALIGEESVDEYTEHKTLIFEDSDLYTAKAQAEISIVNGDTLRQDIRLAGILFRKLGGAIEGIALPLSAGQSDPPVSILRIRENGVEAMIDNTRHLLIGNAEFLRREGIRVPQESTDQILRRAASVSLMYVAIDGILKLGYEIEYQANEAFEALIAELADPSTSFAIRSYDPNLCDTFLYKSRPNGTESVEVIRPGRFEENKPVEISDTGAIVLGEKEQMVGVLHAATSIKRLHRFSVRMQLIASILAGIAIPTLTLLEFGAQITPLAIAGYHLFWMLVNLIASHSELSSERLIQKKKQK